MMAAGQIFIIIVSAFLLGRSFYNYNLAFLAWGALVPYFFILFRMPTIKKAFFLSFTFGSIFYGTLFYWITIVSKWVGPLGYAGWLGTFLYLTLLFSVMGIFLYKICNSLWMKVFAPPLVWVLFEWLQSKGAFGQTAGSLAYSQKAEWLVSQSAAYGGIYLLSFIIVLVNSLILGIVLLRGAHKKNQILFSGYFLAAIIVLSSWMTFLHRDRHIDDIARSSTQALVFQPNVAQYKKLSYRYSFEIFQELYKDMNTMRLINADLYIFPESLIPGLYNQNELLYRQLAQLLPAKSYMLFGSNRRTPDKYYNSLFVMDQSGNNLQCYDKQRIVPFGEYMPFRKLIDHLLPETLQYMGADISPGDGIKLFSTSNHERFGVSICFESIFPEIFYQQHQNGSEFSVVVTNDGWFFDTIALKIHQNATAFRAVESRKQVLFCANTGISSIIQPSGKINRLIAYNSKGYMIAKIKKNTGNTYYYKHFNLFILVCAMVLLLSIVGELFLRKRFLGIK
ncbi:MAG TPA: apolipoprotein N-acyltransferase [Candidatus Margulisbacteria bacterium]|nr:MAG: apolipoprotein N-acyltransferase [Candidatus Margulisbacteria bacterium GWE2_39_32]HCT84874.1 apolipoprotein N-acyltransferase [Candidatus Margulisiibacteriota bacterium]